MAVSAVNDGIIAYSDPQYLHNPHILCCPVYMVTGLCNSNILCTFAK